MPIMTGGEAMARAVKANGIDTVFGLPGAQIYPLFDALDRLGQELIFSRHEQGAAYMAYGAAKSTGRPSAFAVVPGPGVLNTTAALCTAMGACTPVLCMTGQIPSEFLGVGRGHLHELADQPGMLKTLIKDATRIDDPIDSSQIINAAFRTMQDGRPGPVSVEMCWDTMAKPCDVEIKPGDAAIDRPEVDIDVLKQAAVLLAKARKPMIMCGAGAQHAHEEVLSLAEMLNAPVTAFRSGRGIVPEDHELGVAAVAARELFDDVDVLLGIGSRLEMIYMRWRDMGSYEQRPKGGPTLIRIDIDPDEMQRLVPEVGVVGDSAEVCKLLISELEGKVNPDKNRQAEIRKAKALAAQLIEKIQPQMGYMHAIRDILPRDGFMVPELSQMGFTSYFGWPVLGPRTYVTEGFQGTLGFGFPTALGVKVANPDKAVVSVTGDGGFMFCMPELATAVAHNIGLVTLVFNNRSFANIRRDQQLGFDGNLVGADLVNPNFVALAESFGAAGYRVDSPEQLRPVLEKAFADNAPALIEVDTETGSEVSPWEFIVLKDRPSTSVRSTS